MLFDVQADAVPFVAVTWLEIFEAPLRIDLGEPLFSCFIFSGVSCGVAAGSISSAITFGTSCNSRDCSAGFWSSCFFSRYWSSVNQLRISKMLCGKVYFQFFVMFVEIPSQVLSARYRTWHSYGTLLFAMKY